VASKILVVRGGAIGDFVLTLPAIRLLREGFGQSDIEILGYQHIVEMVAGRYYATKTRSIEYGPLARFFAPGLKLSEELVEYFGGFQQVVSYLFDPDGFFEANIRRCGVKNYLQAWGAVHEEEHVARQLARPLERLALFLEEPAAQLFPSMEDELAAMQFLGDSIHSPLLAVHPGSGSSQKNWPMERWLEWMQLLYSWDPKPVLLVCGGEADQNRLQVIHQSFEQEMLMAQSLPLPVLAAVLAKVRLFVGHDSGISHIAAAVGAPSVLLFGPTNPNVWAPVNPKVEIIRSTNGQLTDIELETVIRKTSEEWEKYR